MADGKNIKYRIQENGMDIEYELEPIFKSTDNRSGLLFDRLNQIEDEIEYNATQLEIIRSEISKNTSQADKIDYALAACSGILAGFVDVFFVGEFNFVNAKAWSNEKVNKFVMNIAKKDGFDGERLSDAIKHLEKHKVAHDSSFMGLDIGVSPKSHHLDDLAHHPTLVGLIFSLLTQFSGKAFFVNKEGVFEIVPADLSRIGEDFGSCVYNGVVNWFFHLVSDMSGSNKTAGAGMGIPGPVLSLAKEISSLPIVNESGVSKLLDDLYKREHFDFRAELGVLFELGRQALPVILNEVIVRVFYFIRRFFRELQGAGDVSLIQWAKVRPYKNATITRMVTVASGAFLIVDAADAVLKSGGTLEGFVLRINFVNGIRFIIAVGSEIRYAWKRYQLGEEYQKQLLVKNSLYNLKIDYQQQAIWLVAKDTLTVICSTFKLYVDYAEEYRQLDADIDRNIEFIKQQLGHDIQVSSVEDNLEKLKFILAKKGGAFNE